MVSRFGGGSAAPAGAKPGAARPAARASASKYAGVKNAGVKEPMPEVGEYVFRIERVEESPNPGTGLETYKFWLTLVEIISGGLNDHGQPAHAVGDLLFGCFVTSGQGQARGVERVTSLVMAASGYDEFEEFNAFDPQGLFRALTGGRRFEGCEVYPETGILGRHVIAQVRKGSTRDDGDWYREWAFATAVDEAGNLLEDRIEKAES